MPTTQICHSFSNHGTRNDVRNRVIEKFLKEIPGEGKGDAASKYHYRVENLSDGRCVILRRPANLKNGFDFLICVSDTNFAAAGNRRRDYPKHDDIFDDLKAKHNDSPLRYKKLLELIRKIHRCKNVASAEYSDLKFAVGYPVDLILAVIKWFFIEQDIRFWNYSGRNMLMSGILEI